MAWRGRSAAPRSRSYNLEVFNLGLRRAVGGNVALIFALMLPVLLVTGLGAIQLNEVMTDKKRTQDVADSAALMGAAQIGVTPNGASQRTQSYATAQLADVASNATVQVTAAAGQGGVMTVAIDTQRVSFFGNLLPLGGFHTHVTSIAKGLNTAPLCVLGIAPTITDTIHVTGTSQLQAGQCLVHSNQSLTADPAASIAASASEASTIALGPITPAALIGAPPTNPLDPFSGLNVNPNSCSGSGSGTTITSSQTLASNTAATPYTGPINIQGNAVVTLSGTYYFCKTLTISGNAQVIGTDTVLVFDNGAILSFGGAGATLSLSGRQSGPLAGFVLIADRNYTGTFTLPSDNITSLTGTVYVPTATLAVQGSAKSGATSPWTVIAAKTLTVNGGAQLVINANYSVSNVPVPQGVGNQRQNVQLMQ